MSCAAEYIKLAILQWKLCSARRAASSSVYEQGDISLCLRAHTHTRALQSEWSLQGENGVQFLFLCFHLSFAHFPIVGLCPGWSDCVNVYECASICVCLLCVRQRSLLRQIYALTTAFNVTITPSLCLSLSLFHTRTHLWPSFPPSATAQTPRGEVQSNDQDPVLTNWSSSSCRPAGRMS